MRKIKIRKIKVINAEIEDIDYLKFIENGINDTQIIDLVISEYNKIKENDENFEEEEIVEYSII